MKASIRWMAHNHVAANLLMMVFVIGGLLMAFSIKQEVFPELDLGRITVSVAYPGAGPEEIEDGIILKVEETLSGITGIKEVRSVASEGVGTVTAEVMPGEDIDLVLQDIKAEVDRITTFPEEAEEPVVSKLVNRIEVISVVVYGDMPERSLREHAEAVRDELLAMPGITQVELGGVRPYEISIEVPEANLRRYGLTLDDIARRVRQASVDLPAGSVKSAAGEVLIRTKEKRYSGMEYSDITVVEGPEGSEVRLGDIADVRDAFRETDEFARFDGKPAAMVSVFRVGEQKPKEISRAVKGYVERKRGSLPESVSIAAWNDMSEIFASRMNLLLKNAFLGLIMVFLILGLFLQVRLAMWVMLGIPISFLGALLMMPALDVSINMLSLFAFILALGIVVDDAIVVGENVFEHRSKGKSYMRAAVDGAVEVAVPVTFSVLTTVAAFLPLVFISGTMGKFIKTIPVVVIPILAVSLVESLYVLPSHLGHGKRTEHYRGVAGYVERVRTGFARRLQGFVSGPYRGFLGACLRNRFVTLASATTLLLLTTGLVGGGIVKFRFMPEVEGDFITVTLTMPIGTPVQETDRVQAEIVKKGQEVIRQYDEGLAGGGTILRHIYSVVGGKLPKGPGDLRTSGGVPHIAQVAMMLTPSEERDVPVSEVARKWRQAVGEMPGAESLTFESGLVHFGANVDVQLSHDDFGVLSDAAERIKRALAEYPGVGDITDNYSRGKRELRLRLKPEARTLGVTEADLARQVRAAFYGSEALRLQRGRSEVKVMVRYPEADRKSLSDLELMRIRTPGGGEIPFSLAAHVEEGRGYSAINRTGNKRVLNVTASVDGKVANAEEIVRDLKETVLSRLAADYPGLTFDLEGEEKERKESMGSMATGFAMVLFLIYVLLAIPFRSYSQPLIVMSAIPFGLVGAVLGHMIMGFDLSILSMFGIVALAGVVVNDSLLLIDYINRKRRDGAEPVQAIVEAGQRRFRPILLTSLTTFFGLMPMIMETSVQAQFLIPMAISLAFGILFATGITLIIIPSLYLVLEDIRGLFGLGPSQAGTWKEAG